MKKMGFQTIESVPRRPPRPQPLIEGTQSQSSIVASASQTNVVASTSQASMVASSIQTSMVASSSGSSSQSSTGASGSFCAAGATRSNSSSQPLQGMEPWQQTVSGFLTELERDIGHFDMSGIGKHHPVEPTSTKLSEDEERLVAEAMQDTGTLPCQIGGQKSMTIAKKEEIQAKQKENEEGQTKKKRKRKAGKVKKLHRKPAKHIKTEKKMEAEKEVDEKADQLEIESMEPPDEEEEKEKGLKMDRKNRKSRAYHRAYDKMMQKGMPVHLCQEAGRRCASKIS